MFKKFEALLPPVRRSRKSKPKRPGLREAICKLLPKSNPEMTLEEAREKLMTALVNGETCDCECCGQTAKVYPRRLSLNMVCALVALDRHGQLHARDMEKAARSRDYPALRYFKLATAIGNRRDETRWVITDLGRDFVLGKVRLPLRAIVYNAEFVGYDDHETVVIGDITANFLIDELLDPEVIRRAKLDPAAVARAGGKQPKKKPNKKQAA